MNSGTGVVRYVHRTAERREAPVTTLLDLLRVAASAQAPIRCKVCDGNGRRHEMDVHYLGETSGVKR